MPGGALHGLRRGVTDRTADGGSAGLDLVPGGAPGLHGGGLRIRSLAGQLAAGLPDTRGGLVLGLGRRVFHLGGLVLQPIGQLADALLGLRLDVCLGHQGFHGLAELITGPLDLLPDLVRVGRRLGAGGHVSRRLVCGHRCAFSFTSWTSACTLPMASLGTGGVAL